MYVIRTPGYRKSDQAMRWALPDRVFFACGACHILAHVFVERHGPTAGRAIWVKPAPGFAGNHIFVQGDGWTFDYHGFVAPGVLVAHHAKRARRCQPGWTATLIELPHVVLVSEAGSRAFDSALWLREPGGFLHDAVPRARRFLNRFPVPCR